MGSGTFYIDFTLRVAMGSGTFYIDFTLMYYET